MCTLHLESSSKILFSDKHCTLWGSQGGLRTNCLLYDTDLMRSTLFTYVGIFLLLSTFMDFGVWYYCADINIFDEKEDNNKDDTAVKDVIVQ